MKDYLNINEAARATGLSIPTIRSKIDKGLLPGASQVQDGKRKLWRIPYTDLVAAGLVGKVSSEPDKAENRATALEIRIDTLETELRHVRDTLARADQELDRYRQRESQGWSALETREIQEQRRFRWFSRNQQPPASPQGEVNL